MNNKYVKFLLSASLVLVPLIPGVNMNLYEDEVKLKDDESRCFFLLKK